MLETLGLALLIGCGIGVIVGALGAGGGIVSVPILVNFLGFAPHEATNASLVIVAATAITALPAKLKAGNVRFKEGLVFAAGAALGAIGGKMLNSAISEQLLVIGLVALLLCVGTFMILYKQQPVSGEGKPRNGLLVPIAGVATGFLTGMFGIGGGVIVVPVLIAVLGLSIQQAAGTSLIVMLTATFSAGLTAAFSGGFHIDWPVTLAFTCGSMVASSVASPLSTKANPRTLKIAFGVLLYSVAAFLALR